MINSRFSRRLSGRILTAAFVLALGFAAVPGLDPQSSTLPSSAATEKVPASNVGYGLSILFDTNDFGDTVLTVGGGLAGIAASPWVLGKLGAKVGAVSGPVGAATGFVVGAV